MRRSCRQNKAAASAAQKENDHDHQTNNAHVGENDRSNRSQLSQESSGHVLWTARGKFGEIFVQQHAGRNNGQNKHHDQRRRDVQKNRQIQSMPAG